MSDSRLAVSAPLAQLIVVVVSMRGPGAVLRSDPTAPLLKLQIIECTMAWACAWLTSRSHRASCCIASRLPRSAPSSASFATASCRRSCRGPSGPTPLHRKANRPSDHLTAAHSHTGCFGSHMGILLKSSMTPSVYRTWRLDIWMAFLASSSIVALLRHRRSQRSAP